MERKGGFSTDVVTVEEVRGRLPHTRTLAVEEEKVLRMRHGVTLETSAPLARTAPEGSELADELLLMEMQLLRSMRARNRVMVPSRTLSDSPTKAKIVRALRRKK